MSDRTGQIDRTGQMLDRTGQIDRTGQMLDRTGQIDRTGQMSHRTGQMSAGGVRVGDYVLVHVRRFPSHPVEKTDSQWLGPFLVTDKTGRVLTVQMGKNKVRVDSQMIKKWEGDFSQSENVAEPFMTEEDMKQEGMHFMEKVLGHRQRRGRWEFQIKWVGRSESTWEPLSYLQVGDHVCCELESYMGQHGLQYLLESRET